MADTQGAGPPLYSSPVYDPSANQRGWNDPPSLAFSQKSSPGNNGRRIDPRKRVAHNFNSVNKFTSGAPVAYAGHQQPTPPLSTATPPPAAYNNAVPNHAAPGGFPPLTHSMSYPGISQMGNFAGGATQISDNVGAAAASQPYFAPSQSMTPPVAAMNRYPARPAAPYMAPATLVNPPPAHNGTYAHPAVIHATNMGQPLHTFQPNAIFPQAPLGSAPPLSSGSLTPPMANGHTRCASMPNLPDASNVAPVMNQGPPPVDGYYVRRASSAESSRQNSPVTSPPSEAVRKAGTPATSAVLN